MPANVVPVQDEPRGAIKYRGAGRWFLNSTARRLIGGGVTHFRVSLDADARIVVLEPVKDDKIGRRASQCAGLVKYHGQGFSHQQLCDLVEQQFKLSASELRFAIVDEDSSSDRLVFEVFKPTHFETAPYPEKPGEFEISLRNRNGHGFEYSFSDAMGLLAMVEAIFYFIPPVLAHEEDREEAVDQAIEFATLFLAGCDAPGPLRKWKVAVVRPDGIEQQSWIVECTDKPTPYVTDSGCTRLQAPGRRFWDILAPQGWLLTIEEAKSGT